MIENTHGETKVIEISDPEKLCTAPLASVLMLTYNHEAYLAQALDSILEQKVDFPYEIVIGDDCSTDGTASIAEAYQVRHPDKIRILSDRRNVGVGENFARTYLACRGRFMLILEGDDFWQDANKMAIQVTALEQNPDVVITYHASSAHLDGKPVERHIGARRDLTPWELKSGTPINTLTVAFRRVLTELPDELRLSPIGDIFLWSLLGQHGRGMYIPEINPAYYRMHGGGHYSSKTAEERSHMVFRTYNLLMLYHARVRLADEEEFFRRKVFFFMLRSKGVVYWLRQTMSALASRKVSA